MPTSKTLPRLLALLLALCGLMLLAGAPASAQSAADSFRTRLSDAKAKLESIDVTLARPDLDDATLLRIRNDVEPVRLALAALQTDATGPRDGAKARLDQLGPAPKPEEAPESTDVQATRKREGSAFGDLDGVIKEAQVQLVRADQLANAITERRRQAFAEQLTQRSVSMLDPDFWLQVLADLPRAGWSLSLTWYDASNYFWSRAGLPSLALALAILVAGALAALVLRRRLRALRERIARREGEPMRFLSALDTLLSIAYAVAGWPMIALVPMLASRAADLLPERALSQIGTGLFGALMIAVVYDATGEGILAVDKPALRLLPLSEWAVKRIRRRTRWTAVILGAYALAQAVGKAIYAPISLTVAATALASLLFALISTSLLIRLRSAPTGLAGEGGSPPDEINRLDILRPLLWIAVIGVYACLVTGYVALAGFFAFFPLSAVFIAAIAYILVVLIDTGLGEGLAGDSKYARGVARAIGVRPKNIAFAGTLLSGLLRFVVVAAAALIMTGPLGFYSADIFAAVQRAFFGFQVGGFTISPSSILVGILLLVVLMVVTRFVQRWMRGTLLPRTTLDAGLQNSITTIIGYVGVVLASAIALSEVGLDLQNFAIVAGALSVGIGFGLQSIVSNFVSGLILLAERPIRVGDIIAVAGEEGFVRRISVRATEIETYDRATLIIPNSQLITGTVKNWVYGNTWSRVRVSLAVGYDADVEAVRAAMLAAAEGDPRILPSPPPRVFLVKLGDASLEFELIAVVASVETLAAVRSDLQLQDPQGVPGRGASASPRNCPPRRRRSSSASAEALGAVEAARTGRPEAVR